MTSFLQILFAFATVVANLQTHKSSNESNNVFNKLITI